MISAAWLQVYLCLRVCMGHIHQNGLVPVFRVWGAPKIFPNDDVHPGVSVCGEGFPALYLMRDPKPFESAGERMDERLVLVHLRAGSGTDTYVRVGCPHRLLRSRGTSLPHVPQSP